MCELIEQTKAPLSQFVEAELSKVLAELLPKVKGVVLSDYGSGTITEALRKQVIEFCDNNVIPCVVDSRYDLLSFKGVHYIKQNDAEAAKVAGFEITNDELLLKAGAIILEKMNAKGVLITRGSKGMTLFENNGAIHHVPVTNKSEGIRCKWSWRYGGSDVYFMFGIRCRACSSCGTC